MTKTILLILALLPALAGAEVFRCKDANGRTAYQARPCPEGVATGIDDRRDNFVPDIHALTALEKAREEMAKARDEIWERKRKCWECERIKNDIYNYQAIWPQITEEWLACRRQWCE